MTDATPTRAQRKRVWAHLAFEQLRAERTAHEHDRSGEGHSAGGGSRRPPGGFIAGDGFPRNHPRIPKGRGLLALLGLIWRWRVEIVLPLGAILAGFQLTTWLGPHAAVLTATAVACGCAGPPPFRRAILAALNRLVVRHRFQGLCQRTSLRTGTGRLPLVMNVTTAGGSVLLLIWCRSGMSPELFEDYIPEIKVACFVRQVAIFPHYRWAQLLTLELGR